jgi:hypothetical protein
MRYRNNNLKIVECNFYSTVLFWLNFVLYNRIGIFQSTYTLKDWVCVTLVATPIFAFTQQPRNVSSLLHCHFVVIILYILTKYVYSNNAYN